LIDRGWKSKGAQQTSLILINEVAMGASVQSALTFEKIKSFVCIEKANPS
jgi:hypothetical protein